MAHVSLPTAPQNLEAEKMVLGAVLLDPEAYYRAARVLSAGDFFDPVYRKVFDTCVSLQEQGTDLDFVTVANQLRNDGTINKIGGSSFLADLAASVPTSSHIEHYAAIVRDHSIRRAVMSAGKKILREAGNLENDIPTLTEKVQKNVLELTPATAHKPESIAEVHSRRYNDVAELQADPQAFKRNNIHSGFNDLDFLLGGFSPGSMCIIAARPAMGKSSFALNIAEHAAQQSKQVLFCSLEMTKDQLFDRIASAKMGVSSKRIRKGSILFSKSWYALNFRDNFLCSSISQFFAT